MINPLGSNRAQQETCSLFRSPPNDPYEPTFSEDSINLGIDAGLDPKNNPYNDKPTKNGTTFPGARKRTLGAGDKAEVAEKCPKVGHCKANLTTNELCKSLLREKNLN